MRRIGALAGAVALVLAAAAWLVSGPVAVASPSTVTANGTLTLSTVNPSVGQPLTFHYATDPGNVPTGTGGDNGDGHGSGTDDNWIGIYDNPGYGPNTNGSYGGHGSTVYHYVSGASGDVTFSASDVAGLSTGTKVAFFLYDNQYQWLAQPLAFSLLPAPAPAVDGALTLTTTGPLTTASTLTFSYTVPASDIPSGTAGDNGDGSGSGTDDNWVGIYNDPNRSPYDDQRLVSHGASTSYQYVRGTSGTVSFPASAFGSPGGKVAYLMFDNYYHWLALPVSFYVSAGPAPSDDGTLTLTSTNLVVGAPLSFHYATDTPDPKNWIGLYDDPADGPTDQTYHAPSTTYRYVGDSSGDVTFPTTTLSAGTHTAYLLYQDGYRWLAQPVTFTLAPAPPPPPPATAHFVTDDFLAGYPHTGAAVRQPLAGLLVDPFSTKITFSKAGGDSWLAVSPAGVVTGTAPARVPAHPALIEVNGTDDQGNTASVTVEFDVYGTAVPPQFKATSWDLSGTGGSVADELAIILTNQFDVAGLQGTGASAARTLGTALGWSYYQGSDVGLLSRYPLSAVTPQSATLPAAAATVTAGQERLRVWSAHLSAADYGPAGICLSGHTAAQQLAVERASQRDRQATALVAAMASNVAAAKTTPVLLLADLNSPSQLDWTKAAAGQHCGAGPVAWPVTTALGTAGLTDAYRAANPDPVADPGTTWSPIVATDAATGKPEPQDRIDYVDYAGRVSVVESHALVTGFPPPVSGAGPDSLPARRLSGAPAAAGRVVAGPLATVASSWTSFHAAAVTTFTLLAAPVTPPGDPGSTTPTHAASTGGHRTPSGSSGDAGLSSTGFPLAGWLLAAASAVLAGALLAYAARTRRGTALLTGGVHRRSSRRDH